jgi:hypothetical protein
LAEKVIEVVRLHMALPKCALVVRIDEKARVQALIAPRRHWRAKPGKVARMTHDYKRNGATSLCEALEVATGEVTGARYPQHRHQEFLAFLDTLVKAYPPGGWLGQHPGSRRTQRRLGRYCVGAEGRISHLKRGYGLRRSRLKGQDGMRTWTPWRS